MRCRGASGRPQASRPGELALRLKRQSRDTGRSSALDAAPSSSALVAEAGSTSRTGCSRAGASVASAAPAPARLRSKVLNEHRPNSSAWPASASACTTSTRASWRATCALRTTSLRCPRTSSREMPSMGMSSWQPQSVRPLPEGSSRKRTGPEDQETSRAGRAGCCRTKVKSSDTCDSACLARPCTSRYALRCDVVMRLFPMGYALMRRSRFLPGTGTHGPRTHGASAPPIGTTSSRVHTALARLASQHSAFQLPR
mmetsp:Transcript_43809/g.113965  ORF Transcript_43809/g.113965 Transcript_43809/m.113965 type:complete len:256 (-) Transcript_43809:206-973(-)